MRPQGFLLLLISIPNFILGSLVLLRNVKDKVNLYFALFALFVGLWALGLAGFIFSHDANVAIWWAKGYYTAAALIAWAFLNFSLVFSGYKRPTVLSQIVRFVPTLGILVMIYGFTDFLIQGIAYRSWGKEVILNKSGYLVYSLYFTLYVVIGFIVTFRAFLHARGVQRVYLKFVVIGLLVAFGFGALFNLFYPAFGNYRYIWVGPLFTLAYVTLVAYAIVKHKLFDIRLLVARSLGYVLSIFALGAIYGLVAFNIVNEFAFRGLPVTLTQQIVYTILAVTIAFTFQPLKRFFDRITNKLFYRDAYEPQQLFDGLNKVLVSTIELKALMESVSKIIADTLKAEYCMLSIQSTDGGEPRIVGTIPQKDIHHAEVARVRELLPDTRQKIVIADELGAVNNPLREALRTNEIALMVNMSQKPGKFKEGLGYLVVGTKKSGNPYSSQDVRILEIIADELVIAFQNALRFEEIQNFNITLQEKVDDATRKLRLTNEKLRQLDQTKDDFISMASHQLRTPLTSVKGYVSMVLDEDAGKVSPQQRKLLDQAFISSQRMVYLIADLLNVSRLKTGKFIIEAKPTNLAEVVESELEQLKETAKGRDLKLLFQRPKSFPTLNLDETKIRQVIMNFSDNAIYYTPAGGTITVALADKPESVELTVSDNGIGVPKSEQHHLFTKFYRAGNAKKARPDGTGLGLFMAQKVIVAQGGAIIFHSEENKGSTFGFSFPKAKLLVK